MTNEKIDYPAEIDIPEVEDDEQFPPRTDEEENFYRRGGKLEDY